MPEADTFDAPQGKAFHGVLLQAITEAFVGNGVLANGEGEVTSGSGAMETDVSAASTGIVYGGSTYTPSSSTFTHSNGPSTTTNGEDDRRVDIIYFDVSAGSYAKTEGTADPNPTPPSVPSGDLLLAVVLIEHDQSSNLTNDQILNWHARPIGGTSPNVEQEFAFGYHIGENPKDTISETSSPTGFQFDARKTRDIVDQIDVTLSNNSGASATEDVTVTLYDGTGTGGTQVDTETQSSVTIGDGNSTTLNFLTGDNQIDEGTYYVEVTTSGTDFTVDQTDVVTEGAEYQFVDDADGDLTLVNQFTGNTVLSIDPITDEVGLLNGAIDTAEIASNAVTAAKIAKLTSGIDLTDDPGAFGLLIDAAVTSTPSANAEQSYAFGVDSTTFLEIYTEADGSGGLTNSGVRLHVDLENSDGTTTIWDSSAGVVTRAALDDERVLASTKTSNYTTSGEEVIPVDTSGGAVTITLATADLGDSDSANFITIVDVGGSASTNAITVETEGSENIDGGNSDTIDSDYGAGVYYGDNSQYYTAGGGSGGGGVTAEDDGSSVVDPTTAINWRRGLVVTDDGDGTVSIDYAHADTFEGRESGSVSAGNQGILCIGSLAASESVEVYRAALTTADGQAVASSVDLKLVTLDNAGSFTSQATLITGDGSTVFDDETGSPLGSYTNSGTSAETVAVLVDNGTTSSVDIMAEVEGVTGQ